MLFFSSVNGSKPGIDQPQAQALGSIRIITSSQYDPSISNPVGHEQLIPELIRRRVDKGPDRNVDAKGIVSKPLRDHSLHVTGDVETEGAVFSQLTAE